MKEGFRTMKKMLAAILMLTMAFSLCMGCQKTPESSIVVGKNQEAMLEKAQVKDPQPESEGVGVDFYERLNAPKTTPPILSAKAAILPYMLMPMWNCQTARSPSID